MNTLGIKTPQGQKEFHLVSQQLRNGLITVSEFCFAISELGVQLQSINFDDRDSTGSQVTYTFVYELNGELQTFARFF